jgi:hypothetical protein
LVIKVYLKHGLEITHIKLQNMMLKPNVNQEVGDITKKKVCMESYGTLDNDELIYRDMDELQKKVLATIPRKFIHILNIVLVEPIT